MISEFYDETVAIKRMTIEGVTKKKSLIVHLKNVDCHIQALDDEITKDITNAFGKDLRMFCGILDIIEGDRVFRTVDEETIEYRVSGLKKFDGYCENSHMEINIRAFKS